MASAIPLVMKFHTQIRYLSQSNVHGHCLLVSSAQAVIIVAPVDDAGTTARFIPRAGSPRGRVACVGEPAIPDRVVARSPTPAPSGDLRPRGRRGLETPARTEQSPSGNREVVHRPLLKDRATLRKARFIGASVAARAEPAAA